MIGAFLILVMDEEAVVRSSSISTRVSPGGDDEVTKLPDLSFATPMGGVVHVVHF
jgi:hypothetical protein